MELVFVLVVVAVYVVLFVVRSLSSKAADVKGTPVLGDSFPVIEVYNERREGYKGNEHVQATVSKRKQQATPVKHVAVEKQPIESPLVVEEKKPFSLKKRSEARRAFIHAEIMNRKY